MRVCHSDLSATNGTIPMPLPLILGHERRRSGRGGRGRDGFALGDHVVSSFIYMCASAALLGGRPVLCLEQGKAITTLPDGTRALVTPGPPSTSSRAARHGGVRHGPWRQSVRIDPKIRSTRGAGGLRGDDRVGAVINTAKVTPGSTSQCSAAAASA